MMKILTILVEKIARKFHEKQCDTGSSSIIFTTTR